MCACVFTSLSDGAPACHPAGGARVEGAVGCCQADGADEVIEGDGGGEAEEGDVIIAGAAVVIGMCDKVSQG